MVDEVFVVAGVGFYKILVEDKSGSLFFFFEQEFFYCLHLNRRNAVIGYDVISMGGMTGTVADPRLIIKSLALGNCTSAILMHNHPSGNVKPSRADEELTKKIKHACEYFDIKVLDHIILGEDSTEYFSFADEGLI